MLNRKHPLYVLGNQIDWSIFEQEFGPLYVENFGRPGLPIRLVVGLHYLKYAYNESDELVVERLLENPYWQYFCGFEYFQHEVPLDPSSLVRWRKRVGSEGIGGDREATQGDGRDCEEEGVDEDSASGAGQCGYDGTGEGGGISDGCAVVSQDAGGVGTGSEARGDRVAAEL